MLAAFLVWLVSLRADATEIQVRAGASIEARLEASDDGPLVRGRITTERGEPIATDVRVDVGGALTPAVSDERGEFVVPAPGARGPTPVRVRIDEDARHEAATFEGTLSPALAEVTLRLSAPARASLDSPTLDLEVQGECDAGFAGKEISLSRDGRVLSSAFTDLSGRAILRIGADVLGTPGAARLDASFEGDSVRSPAHARAETLLEIATDLEADVSPRRVRSGDDATISGRLGSRRGPVAGGAISIRIVGGGGRGVRVAAARTDPSGAFRAIVPLADAKPGPLAIVAEYEPDAAWRAGSSSDPIAIRILEPVTVPLLAVLLPSLALLAIAALLLSRLRAPRRRAVRAAPAPAVRAGAILRRPSRKSGPPAEVEITGRVWDPVARRPVAGAAVQIESALGPREVVALSDGSFATGPLPVGAVRLSFSYPGYEPGALEARIPHAGELSDLRFHLVPIRHRLAEVFRDAVAPLASERAWGYATPRQIVHAARSNEAWRDYPLEALRDLVEKGAWGRVEPLVADLRQARELAAGLGSALR